MTADATPDPVSSPAEYQRHLLDLVGDDDPAEVQAATPAQLRELIADAGDDLGTRPEPNEWSALLCIAHMADAELVVGARYRWILAHDEPPLMPYDQDLWVDRLHADDEDPNELLSIFMPLRTANLALWSRTSAEQRARVGIHQERGPESFDLTFRLLAGHDRFHLEQARRALESARGGSA